VFYLSLDKGNDRNPDSGFLLHRLVNSSDPTGIFQWTKEYVWCDGATEWPSGPAAGFLWVIPGKETWSTTRSGITPGADSVVEKKAGSDGKGLSGQRAGS
jgi:hypothetical protein